MTTSTMAADHLVEQRDLLVLDVRTPAEFESAHIETSYNIPLNTLTEHRDEVSGHVDRNVVLVCRSGARAQQARSSLTVSTPADVHVLQGGISAWQAAGYRVVEGVPRIEPRAKWAAGGIGGGLTFAALSNSGLMGRMLSTLPYNRADDPDPRQLIAQPAGR